MQAFVDLLVLIFVLAVNAAASSRSVNGSVSPKAFKSRRVMGGLDAPKGKYPYQVSLWYLDEDFFCGGSIINEYYILTAAHCLLEILPHEVTVKVGTDKLSEPGTYLLTEELIPHKGYPNSPTSDDIGLIRLSEKIVYTNRIQPIALTTKDINKDKTPVILSGWGRTNLQAPSPDSLQEIELQLMDTKQCRQKLSSSHVVTSKQICTFTRPGEGACFGDSGGPLVLDGVQIGVVSGGEPCAIGYPDVYTRVYAYLDWIAENMKLSYNSKN